MDAVAQHVIGVVHDDAAEQVVDNDRVPGCITSLGVCDGVAHGALVAFDVQFDPGGQALLRTVEGMASADDAVARDGQEGAAQRVEMRCCGRIGVGGGALGGPLLICTQCAAAALRLPRLPVRGLGLEVLGNVAGDVGVRARVAGLRWPWIARLGGARRAGVVDVVGGLLPGVEHHLLVGVVRVQRGDDALGRVVEQHRTDPDQDAKLQGVCGAEVGLVLADWLALVVEDGPAAANPT